MADEVNEKDGEIEALKAKNKELIAELRKAKGSTNEEAARLAEELDTVKAENVKLNAALKKATDTAATQLKEATDKLTAKSATIQKLIRDEGLLKGLTEAGVKKEYLKAALAMHRDAIEVDEEKGEAFATVNGTRKPLNDYLKEWASGEEGKNFIAAPNNSGGGANPPGSAPAGKNMQRAAFDALDAAGKAAFVKDGGTLTD